MINLRTLFIEHRKAIITVNLIGLLTTALGITIPRITGTVINEIETNQINYNLITTFGIIVFLILISGLSENILVSKLGEKIASNLRNRVMNKLTKLDYNQVNKQGIGNIITLMSSDIDGIKQMMSTELMFTFQAILLFIGSLTIMLISNWRLGLVALVSLPIIVGVFIFTFKSVTKFFKQSFTNQSQTNTVISQNIYASNLIRVQNSQDYETEKFNLYAEKSELISRNIVSSFGSLIPTINGVTNWTVIAILYVGAILYAQKGLEIGDISSFLTYYSLLITPIFIIGFNSQSIARANTSISRINELLKQDEVKKSGEINQEIKTSIELKNVNVIRDQKKILKNINLTIPINKRIAIVGPTGAGKSVLINLINGLIKPDEGSIILDEIDYNNWQTNSIHSQIATVFQESLIFNTTLKDNIILNLPFNEGLFNRVCLAANLTEFSNEDLMTKKVSELGGNLSGGQKQRLTLARAIYRQPKILILDDFTARVDKKTENQIWTNLNKEFPNIGLINISQSIETIKDFDLIFVLMEGELVGSGTHKQLLETNLEYQQIYNSQKIISD